jgi:triosephosphate isomerase
MTSNKKLIVGNWKNHPDNITEAKKVFNTFKKQKHQTKNITTVFCPPALYFNEIKKSYSGSKIFFGMQNMSWDSKSSQTGEISPEMVKDSGAKFLIVGHSERRALGENNEMVAQKLKEGLKLGLHVILCIGEPERDEHGNHLKFIDEELRESLSGISKLMIKKLIIAYEPIWTIGKGKKAMTPEDLHRMSLYVHTKLVSIFGRKNAENIPILYGGSVNSDNAKEIIYEGSVDGLLIGRASLNPFEFSKIIDVVSKKK